jgi:hypothetical protein
MLKRPAIPINIKTTAGLLGFLLFKPQKGQQGNWHSSKVRGKEYDKK